MKPNSQIFRLLILGLMAILFSLGCGVKGQPLPPLTPVQIGRGEANFSKATEKIRVQKKKDGVNTSPVKPGDDFEEEPVDFKDEDSK